MGFLKDVWNDVKEYNPISLGYDVSKDAQNFLSNAFKSPSQPSTTMPNSAALLSSINSAYNPASVNAIYSSAMQNLLQQRGNSIGQAQSGAGALAGANHLLNGAGFVANAGSTVNQSYAPAIGNLNTSQATMLQNLPIEQLQALLQYQQMSNQYSLGQQGVNNQQAGNTIGEIGAGANVFATLLKIFGTAATAS